MAKTFNKTILIGRLGQDPTFKQTEKTDITHFSICQTIRQNDKESTQWHRICAFGKQAQLCYKYLHKGDLCCIEGRLDSSSYTKNGEKKYVQSIIAENITFLSSSRRNENRPQPETTEDDILKVFG